MRGTVAVSIHFRLYKSTFMRTLSYLGRGIVVVRVFVIILGCIGSTFVIPTYLLNEVSEYLC